MPLAALISFRLGGSDGVSIEAAKWADALRTLGWQVRSVAGQGPVDTLLPGLAMDAPEPPGARELQDALAPADLVVVENLCSLPLNPAASDAVAAACAGRPAVLHHHDLAWQRPHLAHLAPPPDNPAWAHVTINDLSRRELSQRGIAATTLYNHFDPAPPHGDREGLRRRFGVGTGDRLLLQPTRALPRKNVAAGMALAAAAGGGIYWLLGPAEDGYGPELDQLVAQAQCPVLLGFGAETETDTDTDHADIHDAYAACDAVLLPSTWEGFGNPTLESATHRRPLAVGPYPVAAELAAFGFHWFDSTDAGPLSAWLDHRGTDADADAGPGPDSAPVPDILSANHAVAARHFNLADLPRRLSEVLDRLPGIPR